MKVYLDNSFLNRPFDNPAYGFNRIETDILFWILRLIEERLLILVNSSVVEYENSLNPFLERKLFTKSVLRLATVYQNIDDEIERVAEQIHKTMEIDPIDALHIASAERARVDFSITCDYNLIKRYKGTMAVVSPRIFLERHESS